MGFRLGLKEKNYFLCNLEQSMIGYINICSQVKDFMAKVSIFLLNKSLNSLFKIRVKDVEEGKRNKANFHWAELESE